MSIAAGRLMERVTIQRATPTTDSSGGQVTVWRSIVADRPAEVRPISGRENTDTEALTGLQSYRVVLRFSEALKDVDATYRLKWRGGVLRVLGATHDRLTRASELTCEAGAGVVTGGIDEDDVVIIYTPGLDFSDARNSQYLGI